MPETFSHSFRVRYAEVDPQSVVFNSRYLEYADLIITEYWRECGLHFTGEGALEFHVARAEVDFVKPIRADEIVEGRARTARIGRTSVETRIEFYGAQGPEDLRARIMLVHVHVDLDSGQPVVVPEAARKALGRNEENEVV
ncbi:acyl-CoA thioesterase [Altererythrobacter sp.]|uniref:acyl-CoA thioesterase n=1 Tax=Altererythrobacter sp. TaxID=1872480 RepID=UPI003CFDB5A9